MYMSDALMFVNNNKIEEKRRWNMIKSHKHKTDIKYMLAYIYWCSINKIYLYSIVDGRFDKSHCYPISILHCIGCVVLCMLHHYGRQMVEFYTKTSITWHFIHKKYETFDEVTNGTKHKTHTHAHTNTRRALHTTSIYDWCVLKLIEMPLLQTNNACVPKKFVNDSEKCVSEIHTYIFSTLSGRCENHW